MQSTLLQRLANDVERVPPAAANPFTHAYFAFLRYFRDLPEMAADHVFISALTPWWSSLFRHCGLSS
jgi:hypothetical protein